MSTIKSSAEHLTLNADGSGNDIKFQSNGSEVASISDGGVVTATSFSGSGANLTGVGVAGISSSADATAMTIDSSERIGIGRTSAGSFVDVYNTGNYTGLRVETTVGAEVTCQLKGGGTSSSANVLDIRNGSNGSLFEVRQDGRGLSQFTAKAWASWNLNGTASIHDSHNVSSLSDNGTGDSTIFFANNMANTNYAVAGMSDDAFRLLSLRDQSYTATSYTRFASTITSNSTWDDAHRLMATWFGD